MSGEHMKGEAEILRVVEALEAQADSMDSIATFFSTLDLALTEHMGDAQRINAHSFIRAYQQAARQMEEEADEAEQGNVQ